MGRLKGLSSTEMNSLSWSRTLGKAFMPGCTGQDREASGSNLGQACRLRTPAQKEDRAGAVVSDEAGGWSDRPWAHARLIAARRPYHDEVDVSSGCDIADGATWLTSNLDRLDITR